MKISFMKMKFLFYLFSSLFIKYGSPSNIARKDQYVVKGIEVKEGEFPFLARVVLMDKAGVIESFCGGFILTRRTVVTAAHCFVTAQTVIAGEHHVDMESGDEVFVRIKEFIPHPDYNFFGSLWSNDIALLILEEPLPLGPRPGRTIALKAAKLTEEEIVPGTSVTVMGFGHLKYGGNESKVLRKNKLTVINPKTCKAEFEPLGWPYIITPLVFCAWGPNAESTCQGDSGGPVVLTERPDVVVGTVCGGYKCGEKPGVYSNPNCPNLCRPSVD